MRRTIIPVLTLGVTLGALAACGGNDDADTSNPAQPQENTSVDGSEPVEGSEPSTDEYCSLAEEVGSVATKASPGSSSEDILEAQEIMKNSSRLDEGNELMQDAAAQMRPVARATAEHIKANCDI